jgi:hypothetical protein
MKCKKCNYQWIARKENPKACPRCKNRIDKMLIIPRINTTKIIPLSIQVLDKYYNIEYKNGKLITNATLDVDEATNVFFQILIKKLNSYFNK